MELVGSMARGCAQLGSDLDLNLAAHDWNEQVEWRRLWVDPQHRQRFLAALGDVVTQFGLVIDIAPNNPDQDSYDLTYDFMADVFTRPERPFPDLTSRAWDGYQFRWVPVPLTYKAMAFDSDRWEGDVARWEAEYGQRFLLLPTSAARGEQPAPEALAAALPLAHRLPD
jgi:hypothetical protein